MPQVLGGMPPASAKPLAGAPHTSTEKQDRSILIVDDEESIRWLFSDCLGARYFCTTAGNADEALSHMAREEFALVLADVSMPGLSGIELLRHVIARHPDTAVIMISGIDRTQRVLDAVRIGASDYLIKPIDLHVLELSVERALERRALLRDARHYKQDLERRNSELAKRKAELERLQAQIVHSEKMASLGQLAAGVAHELNNPAGFIYGNMDFLADSVDAIERLLTLYDSATLSEHVRGQVKALKEEIDYENTLSDLHSIIADCREGAERIRNVVQNLRTFSRLDEAEFKKVDIHEGLDATVRLLSRYYSQGRVTLKRAYGELPPVDCYAGQLNQVWMNLLANAAQAVEAAGGGEVTIQTHVEKEKVMVAISDTGCGIEPEHMRKIFDPFFTTKPVGEGTGLGLSVTYGIVERHGGFIRVRSRPGQGSTFVVGLPVGGVPQPQQQQPTGK
ncbi:MAG TPA: ATP-binding protein [Pyrinomonadaceae bacterium]|nr:ATP-binding protein [Pyrinomonadaceae bacterium]